MKTFCCCELLLLRFPPKPKVLIRRCPADFFLKDIGLIGEVLDEIFEVVEDNEEDRFNVEVSMTGNEAKYVANTGGRGFDDVIEEVTTLLGCLSFCFFFLSLPLLLDAFVLASPLLDNEGIG